MSVARAKLPPFITPAMLVPPVGEDDVQTSQVISSPPNLGSNFSPNWNKLWTNGVKIGIAAQGKVHKVRVVAGIEVLGCELKEEGRRQTLEVSLVGMFLYHPHIHDDAATPLVMGLFCYQYEERGVPDIVKVKTNVMMVDSRGASGGLYTYVEGAGVDEERCGMHRSTRVDKERFGSLFEQVLHYPVNNAVREELAQIPNLGEPSPGEDRRRTKDGGEIESMVGLWDPEERTVVDKGYATALLACFPNARVSKRNEYRFPSMSKRSPEEREHFKIFRRWARNLIPNRS